MRTLAIVKGEIQLLVPNHLYHQIQYFINIHAEYLWHKQVVITVKQTPGCKQSYLNTVL